jgi:hypothetical protein
LPSTGAAQQTIDPWKALETIDHDNGRAIGRLHPHLLAQPYLVIVNVYVVVKQFLSLDVKD